MIKTIAFTLFAVCAMQLTSVPEFTQAKAEENTNDSAQRQWTEEEKVYFTFYQLILDKDHENLSELLTHFGYVKPPKGMPGLLSMAAYEKNLDAVKLFLKHGVKASEVDEKGVSAVSWAAMGGELDIVSLLIEQGGRWWETENDIGALAYAVGKNHLEIVKYLVLEQGADIKAFSDRNGKVMRFAAVRGHVEIMKFFVEQGVDLQQSYSACCHHNVLMDAAYEGQLPMVKYLYAQGFTLEHKSQQAYTALLLAIEAKHNDVVEWLLAHSARVDVQQANGQGPLHLAIKHQNIKILPTLLKKGAALEIKDRLGYTPLALAVYLEKPKAVKILAAAGADIQVQVRGLSLLELANQSMNQELKDTVKALFANK